jgi:hypothetical protein
VEREPYKQFPYVGPLPFDFSDAKFFGGRDSETRRIVDEIFVNRIFLLYAQSGAGKTSLLNAGIIPRLKEEGCEVFPPARVAGLIPHGINGEEISNIYVLNSILCWIGTKADLKQLSQKTIADYLMEREHPLDEVGQPRMRVIIFDQLEDIFSVYQEYWQHRAPFFQQVNRALEQDRFLRVVFALREDYLGSMEAYAALLADKPQMRFRLEPLRKEGAMSALVEPLRETGLSFDEGVAERLVDELLKIQVETPDGSKYVTGEFIEAAQLQVICHTLWRKLPSEKKVITIDDVEAFANVDRELATFYDTALERAAYATGVDEKLIREWFGRTLITPSGTRAVVVQGDIETGGLPNSVLEQLVSQYLIRAEVRGGRRWFELAHDRFIQPVLQSNQKHSKI